MKTIALLLMLLPVYAFSQKLEVNKVDEFTKKTIKETSWEVAVRDMNTYSFFRIRSVDVINFLEVKLMFTDRNKVLAIHQDDELMLMLSNDSIVTLKALESTVSCRGCGARGFSGSTAMGIMATYFLDQEAVEALKSLPIKKFRIYTTSGHISIDVNDKNSSVLKELLPLVQ